MYKNCVSLFCNQMLLKESYYQNPDVLFIARDLIGKVLLTEIEGLISSGIIVETEAYRAPEDRASHAFGNKITERTQTMFLSGGHAYIYLCYGLHEMFNVVTAEKGKAHAVLIRGVQPHSGLDLMMHRRNHSIFKNQLTKGPGSVTKALGISRLQNACLLYQTNSPVRIYDEKIKYSDPEIGVSKRIGVGYAAESAIWPFRFYVKDNPFVSAHPK